MSLFKSKQIKSVGGEFAKLKEFNKNLTDSVTSDQLIKKYGTELDLNGNQYVISNSIRLISEQREIGVKDIEESLETIQDYTQALEEVENGTMEFTDEDILVVKILLEQNKLVLIDSIKYVEELNEEVESKITESQLNLEKYEMVQKLTSLRDESDLKMKYQ